MKISLAAIQAERPTLDMITACEYLGISKSLGYRQAAEGRFPAKVIKVGGRYKVVTASLLALLEAGEQAAA